MNVLIINGFHCKPDIDVLLSVLKFNIQSIYSNKCEIPITENNTIVQRL